MAARHALTGLSSALTPAAANESTTGSDSAGLARGWRAELALRFEANQGRTRLAEKRHNGPLLVQRPFYPEGQSGGAACHVYLLHPPAGIVGGDSITLDATVETNAAALITTPAATKFYRSNGGTARCDQRLRVAPRAMLEWMPQENIVFDGARMRLSTIVSLQEDARFVGWEVICLGRPASGERLQRGACDFRLEIERDGQPLLRERLSLVDDDPLLSAKAGLQGMPVVGVLVATIEDDETVAAVRASIPDTAGILCGVSVVDGLLTCRVLSADTQQARTWLVRTWEILRPRLSGRAACHPRIWWT